MTVTIGSERWNFTTFNVEAITKISTSYRNIIYNLTKWTLFNIDATNNRRWPFNVKQTSEFSVLDLALAE